MPLTDPDGIYYADSTAKMSAAAISAAEASSIQNALNTYRVEIDERSVAAVPPGVIVRWPKVTDPPENWFLCDGAAISRTVYSDLFNVTGTFYGVGDGVNTFNLPDLSGDPNYDFIIKYRFSDGLRGIQGPAGADSTVPGPEGPQGIPGFGFPQHGQASRIISGTIDIAATGVYQSTGLSATLDTTTDEDIALGTADPFGLKNVSGDTRLMTVYASMDATVGGANESLGIKLALDGVPIDETECRATTGVGGSEAKLVTSWLVEIPNNSEISLFVANHSNDADVILRRGRILASTVTAYGAGVVPGGTTGQVLAKTSNTDFDTAWVDSLPTDVVSPVSGDSLVYDGTDWVNGPRSGNAIINGDFGVWQRGTSFTAETGYTADRWTVSNGVGDVTQSTDVPNDIFEYSLFFESSTTAFSSISTRLESADTHSLLGKSPVTFSAYMKVNQEAIDNGGNLFFQTPATKDDFTSSLTIAAQSSFSTLGLVADAWKRVEVELNFPALSGNVQNGLQIRIDPTRLSSAGTASLRITGVQLEAGSVATPFRLAGGGSKAAELALCQRYYYSYDSANFTSFAFGTFIGTTTFRFMIPTPVQMRKFPSIFVTDLSGIVRGNGSSFTPSSISNAETSPFGVTAIANITGGFDSHAGTVADAELISLDAEL